MHNTKSTVKTRTVKLENKPKIKISERALEEMKLFCRRLPKEEWSALLYYTVDEGTIDVPEGLHLTVQCLWPMAKGSGAAVDFEYDADWINVYDKVPEVENFKLGVIHSHNSMGAFHSGTDYDDLATNCSHYDFYVSLVVNNRMEFDCKIAISGEEEAERKSIFSFKKEALSRLFSSESSSSVVKTPIMMVLEAEVEAPEIIPTIFSTFEERMEEVIKKAETPKYSGYARGFGYDWNKDARKYGYSHSPSTPPTLSERQLTLNKDWDQVPEEDWVASTPVDVKYPIDEGGLDEEDYEFALFELVEDLIRETLEIKEVLSKTVVNPDISSVLEVYTATKDKLVSKQKDKEILSFLTVFTNRFNRTQYFQDSKDKKDARLEIFEGLSLYLSSLEDSIPTEDSTSFLNELIGKVDEIHESILDKP